ncbi:MAG: energy transducer TonB [Opitutaceae bacterium]|nr:energy transducer TonB [Opitutaceae bacterium]
MATDGGRKARPTARYAPPRRSWCDLLLAAVAAAALHVAVFVGGSCVAHAPVPESEANPITLVDPMGAAAIPLSLDAAEPASNLERLDAELEPGSAAELALPVVTIVPLDLFRSEFGSMSVACARVAPVAPGRGAGFRPDRNFLNTVGRGTRFPAFELAELDQPPVILAQPLPQYPPALLRTGASGEALVCFVVSLEGTVRAARVTLTTHPEFAVPALQAVARWKFRPGRKDGRAVATRVEVPIAFEVPAHSKIRRPLARFPLLSSSSNEPIPRLHRSNQR